MSSPPPLPELPDEILGEAFLRLPPDDPACLLRASLACKRWRRILADPVFRRRHRELHRTPALVGFLHILERDAPYASRFVPNSTAPGGPAARDLPGWLMLDCRHGRALFLTLSSESRPGSSKRLVCDFIVWDPLTNERRRLPRPSPPPTNSSRHNLNFDRNFNAAVLCAAAAEGCDHSECHGGPFRVAFVWSRGSGNSSVTSARVYSSETDDWSEPISVQHPDGFLYMMPCPSTLVGDTLYFRFRCTAALEYQLGTQSLSIISAPPQSMPHRWVINLMSMEDGGLGCMVVEEDESSLCLRLWSREAASRSGGAAGWTRGRAIELEKLLPDGAPRLVSRMNVALLGFAEGTDVIFVGTRRRNHPDAVYMVQLNSGRARKVFDGCTIVIPYTRFCIPVIDPSSTTEVTGDDALPTTPRFQDPLCAPAALHPAAPPPSPPRAIPVPESALSRPSRYGSSTGPYNQAHGEPRRPAVLRGRRGAPSPLQLRPRLRLPATPWR